MGPPRLGLDGCSLNSDTSMESLNREILDSLPTFAVFVRMSVRLCAAAVLGALIGYDREKMGKPAGLRTHMLVSMGAALFVLAPAETGMAIADLSRVVQGLAAGVGFLGAGAILKLTNEREVIGLTTAATIWMTAAVGVSVGFGRIGLAMLAVVMTLGTLTMVRLIEDRWGPRS
jgi:putative Mg2+ transporter-C (MgtC) family protein